MSADVLVAIVALAAALVLAIRGLRGYALGRNRMLTMIAIWVAIIAVLAFLLQRFPA